MRHRIIAARYGLTEKPFSVVELGPGDSLGIGLMALLTGSERYIAIDAVRHASLRANLAIFDELVTLLRNRTPIPSGKEYAEIRPELDRYDFPHDLLGEPLLEESLAPDRLSKIRDMLSTETPGGAIRYLAPLGEMGGIPSGSVDWVFSQAVMEHVDDPGKTYRECFRCLKPGGMMTHQIDFRCHETASEWNGHWKYPQWLWSLMRGRRPWFVNRLTYSAHQLLQQEAGFKILADAQQTKEQGINRHQLARSFQLLSDQDLSTVGALFVTMKSASK
jgi:SAM-dependent methyltransferase